MNRLLLDTHTFLWWDSAPERLSATVFALCQDPDVRLLLSIVSLWEIQIKSSLGKIPSPLPLAEIIQEQQARHGLPLQHKNPFDRLLIAQALTEKLPPASVDTITQDDV